MAADHSQTASSEPTSTAKPKRSLVGTIGIILAAFLANLLIVVAVSGCSIVLPDIGKDLNMQQDNLQWVPSAFALSSSCFFLLCGRLADLYGRKLVFLIGSAWMSIFGLGCGFARSSSQLLVLRGFQGIGGAASITASMGILAQSFPPGSMRRTAFAIFAAGAPAGWRAFYFFLAGLSVASLCIGYISMDNDSHIPNEKLDKRVDWMGAALVTAAMVCIMFVLGQGSLAPQKWRTPYIIALLITGVFLLIAFIIWEDHLGRRTTFPPLMRLDIWTRARGRFTAIQIIAFLEWSSFMSWILWVQLYYQTYKRYTPLETTIRLIPMNLTGFVLLSVVGLIAGRVPAIYLLSLGTIATGLGCLLFAIIQVDAPYWSFGFPSAVLIVWGADFVFSAGMLFVSRVAREDEQSVAGGIFQTCIQLGTSYGLAVTTIVYDQITSGEASPPPELQLKGYRAAQWAAFGLAMCALAVSMSFRGVGVVGGKADPVETGTKEESEAGESSTIGNQSG
ncbi:MFS general substrate transporter [Amanita rubescens]|nr:MFS general substrate transporter [Amanita rubescens]